MAAKSTQGFLVRVPTTLAHKVRRFAKKLDISANKLMVQAVEVKIANLEREAQP